MSTSPRIAISLGASFMGYATHAGFMAALHARGLRPVAVAGSSAGAITAGLYAAGLSQQAIRDCVLSPRLFLSFASRTKWIWHHLLDVFTRRRPGFFNASGAIPHFESLVGRRGIESLTHPRLMIALSDLEKHETIYATRGPLARAMAASSCVPTLFAPLEFEGRACTDGGVVHEAPVDPWFDDDDIDHIILHRIIQQPTRPSLLLPGRLLGTIGDSHQCLSRQILADRIDRARHSGKKLTIVSTEHPRPSPFFPGRLKETYALGEATARAWLDSGGEGLTP